MACEQNNTNSNVMKSLYGSHLSANDLPANSPIFSWASSSEAICTYSMNSYIGSEAILEQQVTGSHNSIQDKGMPDMPRGICEDHTHSSLHTALHEAPTCSDWQHPLLSSHTEDQHKSRIATDGSVLLVKDNLDPHSDDHDLQQLEEYVNELVPALHMVNQSTHNMNIAHRQQAIKLTADALLVRRATGMAWSDALSKRVSDYCIKHEGMESTELAELDMAGPHDESFMTPIECASSSCIRTPVTSSEGTNSCELSDHDFSTFHHESTASLPCSDHSSMVDSTSELLQDDMDVLNYAQSGVSLPLMDILSSSDAHMSSANSSGELLSMCKGGENELKRESELQYEEINARLACKEWNEDAMMSSNSALLKSLQAAASFTREEHVCTKGLQQSGNISSKEHVFHYNTCNDTPADVKDYHHYMASHAGEGTKSFHLVHHDMPSRRGADVAPSEQSCHDLAPVSQLPCADVDNGNEVAWSTADVAHHVIHIAHELAFDKADVAQRNSAAAPPGQARQYELALGNADVEGGEYDMTGLQGMQMHDKAALDDVAGAHGAEVEAIVEADVEGGPEQGMACRTKKDDVAHEVANEGQVGADVEGGLSWQQASTWQGSMYELGKRVDVAVDVLYGANTVVDAEVGGAIRRGSHAGNHKMREMMYRVAAYQPIDWESIMKEVVGKERPKRRNVRISKEPQSIAARRRRERISERIRILQRLVPGTSKLDTASMLDEAIQYLKFLKLQVQALQRIDKFFTSQLRVSIASTTDCTSHLAQPYPAASATPNHPFPLQI